MNKLAKASSLALLLLLMATSIIMVESVSAQSIPKPSVPEFSVKVIDDSYLIPFKNVTTTDPYTGKVTWLIEGGGHVENQKVVVTIKNPPFTPVQTSDGYMTDLCFSVRAKGHYEDWQASAEAHLIYAANVSYSEYTVVTYYLQGEPGWGSFHDGGEVDVQVKSVIGYHYTTEEYSRILPGPIYTVHNVELKESDWSSTQTALVPKELANPLPPWWTGPTPEPMPNTTLNPTYGAPTATPMITPTPTVVVTPTQNPTVNPAQPITQTDVLFGLDWRDVAVLLLAVVIAILVVAIFFMRNKRIKVRAEAEWHLSEHSGYYCQCPWLAV